MPVSEVVFSMPLRKEAAEKKPASTNSSPTDLGYDTQDSLACSPEHAGTDSEGEEGDAEEGEEGTPEWLQSMGFAEAHIKKLNTTQGKMYPYHIIRLLQWETVKSQVGFT